MKSWKTTLLGVCMILGSLGSAGVAYLDGNPETVANWETVLVALTGGFGLIFARDNDKASEDVGAK